MNTLTRLHAVVPALLSPTHPYVPFGLIDIFGAARLSLIINWIATGGFEPDQSEVAGGEHGVSEKGAESVPAIKVRERGSLLQELFGLMVVVFGGETFLCMCSGTTPSWLVSPKVALLFCGIHILQTRTPLASFLPRRPSLPLELLLSLPDAIGRTLLLTRFSILPLLTPTPTSLPATPSSLLLTPFILAVPFASISFSTFNLFSPSPSFTTPLELRKGGWLYADTWIPVLVPFVFLTLIGPVKGWGMGMRWEVEEAFMACLLITWGVFAGRTIYNMGANREAWDQILGPSAGSEKRKIKTA